MLESGANVKITTAKLAAEVGVSEAALYRHFPSKTRMFEALIEFVEETLFSRINLIVAEDIDSVDRCRKILLLLLSFCDRNPGITRILSGGVTSGEDARIHTRVGQIFDRLETQLRQVLRQAEMEEKQRTVIPVNEAANMMLTFAEGKIAQFVRSDFKRSPSQGFNEQWAVMTQGFMQAVYA